MQRPWQHKFPVVYAVRMRLYLELLEGPDWSAREDGDPNESNSPGQGERSGYVN